ncbi:hypothetical protein ABZV60_30175 [Streptomyces sp. NPDC004787]|uniref:hypothetical protein n=1 Tax=Streptomyces sp. NPDC004787 TaxID=3154291 RepID=UPI0033B029E0
MRPHASPRLTALAISAALTLGTAGPAFADEHRPSRPATHAGVRAPLPDSATLLAQAKALGELGSVSTPVTELITAALKADDGQLPAADAAAFKAKIQTAVDEAKGAAPAPLPEAPAVGTPVTPPAAEAPVTPLAAETPVAPPAVVPPAASAATSPVTSALPTGARAAAPADVVGDALATVQKAVAELLAAVTSGNAAGVVPQVTATLTSLVNLAVATVLGSGLPAPDLPGLPTLPTLPADLPVKPPVSTGDLPVKPPVSTDTLPVKPPVSTDTLPVKPPVSTETLPATPALPVR